MRYLATKARFTFPTTDNRQLLHGFMARKKLANAKIYQKNVGDRRIRGYIGSISSIKIRGLQMVHLPKCTRAADALPENPGRANQALFMNFHQG